jgi:hypothetical protein
MGDTSRTPRQDTLILKLSADVYVPRYRRRAAARAKHQKLLEDVVLCAEEGFVAVVWGGRDCDGVQYEGRSCAVPANTADVTQHIADAYAWADGPCHFAILSPSAASDLEYYSCDLVMEAHENGHPHVLHA